jgi:hypothetical protein
MATIRRHPVPAESYVPDRPLNDLGRDQFEHFKHAASRLPAEVRAALPAIPSAEDGMAAGRFIAAVTDVLIARKRQPLKLVSKRARKLPAAGLALAAGAEAPPAAPPHKKRSGPKSRSRSPRV